MFFRTRPVRIEARDWDGSMEAGLDLVTWVNTRGGFAHLDSRGKGMPEIVVGPAGFSERMKPEIDLLCLDHDTVKFFVRDRRQMMAEFVEVEKLDA